VNQKRIRLYILFTFAALVFVGCSGGSNSGQAEALKPPPNVRVEALSSSTPAAPQMIAEPSVTPTVTPTAQVVYFYDPTPDSDALANQIQAIIDDINRRLQGQDTTLK
jgi:PBP1b-binding outer membrane lipoprotein LpoB